MSAIDSVAAIQAPVLDASAEVKQAPEGNSGIIPGNQLGDVMASPDGQKVMALISESIQMNIASDNKRHNQRLIKSMKESRRERQS